MKNLILITLFSFCLAFGCSKSDPVNSDGNGNNNGDNGNGGNDIAKITMDTSDIPSSVVVGKNKLVHNILSIHNVALLGEVPMMIAEVNISKEAENEDDRIDAPVLQNECTKISTYINSMNYMAAEKIENNSHSYKIIQDTRNQSIPMMQFNAIILSKQKYRVETQFEVFKSHRGATLSIKLYSIILNQKQAEIARSKEYNYNYIIQ